MKKTVRIATFNLENFDDKPGVLPSLQQRIALMQPQLLRLNADIICLQEVNSQKAADQSLKLLALDELIKGTPYSNYYRESTKTVNGTFFDVRNLVILSKYEIISIQQYNGDQISPPSYKEVTANPPETNATTVLWERPILHAKIKLSSSRTIDLLNVHLKSKIPVDIKGQKVDAYTWATASGWAEGYFISSMKRLGQALEARIVIDKIFNINQQSDIIVCGDFNSTIDDVPVMTLRGDVENTGNANLTGRILLPCELTVPESSRYSLIHQGKGEMIDHILVSRSLLSFYHNAEVHNEMLHDKSVAFSTNIKYPESDHAPVIAEFFINAD
jgi:exonuclease III